MFEYSLKDGFLTDGSVVILPTDTVYGIACRLYDESALQRIFKIKVRSQKKNLAVLCESLVSINDIAVINERALKLAHAFWPGPLTIILPSTKQHYEKTGDHTIGVRIPNHAGTLQLIKQNGPLYTTSVNISGTDPLMDLAEIKKEFKDKVDYIYEEYNTYYLSVSSTIIDLTNENVEYLRLGTITKKAIEEVLSKPYK